MDKPRVVETEVRVRYAETDAQGIVYYSNYFVWFEVGRVDYFRELGLSYADLEREGLGFLIAEASCRYHAPARFDELLMVRTWVEEVKSRSFVLAYKVVNKGTGKLLATGRTVQVFVNQEGKPIAIPPRIKALLEE